MKKVIICVFLCLGLQAAAEPDTLDIRKYHQQLEERVFELEEGENQDEKISEAFLHGKRRISDAERNEKAVLEGEGKEDSVKLAEIETAEKKYDEIMAEYEKLAEEKKKLIYENKIYMEQLEKIKSEGEEKVE
ncbi:MAG: hypothetical protein ACLT40_05075 [Fusobacterium sp.]